MFLIGDSFGQGLGDPHGGSPRNTPPGDPPEGFLQGILSHLESPSLNVALRLVGSTFSGFFMLSSTPTSLNGALREVGFKFFES
jgi:hypothetical protein